MNAPAMSAKAESRAMANAYLNNIGAPGLTLKVCVDRVWGRYTIYPANETAELFAQIAGTKTLTNSTLALAERLGFLIEQVPAVSLPASFRSV